MEKKQFKINGDKQFVYHSERTCRHCGATLAENATARREFCQITHDPDGKVRDCKSAYHRKNDKPDREMFAMITANNKAIFTRIEYLIERIGEEVTSKHLEDYQINLIECIDAKQINGLVNWYFIKHVIITNHITEKHKIERHDKYTNNGAIA
jgi:hypothetical protein